MSCSLPNGSSRVYKKLDAYKVQGLTPLSKIVVRQRRLDAAMNHPESSA